MNKIIKIVPCFVLVFIEYTAFAQEVEMADTMRTNGKIYVLLTIVLVILIGLIGYLLLIDRKITRLEKQLTDLKK